MNLKIWPNYRSLIKQNSLILISRVPNFSRSSLQNKMQGMASHSNATLNGAHAIKRMAELEETYRLQRVEIEHLWAELAMLKENNQILSNLNSSLQEREVGCVRAVAEKELRLSEALESCERLKKEVSELENLILIKKPMECKTDIDELSNVNDEVKAAKETFLRKLAEKELELKTNAQAMEIMERVNSDLKVENQKLKATMQQLIVKFHQMYVEHRKIPELMAEVDRLHQELSHGSVLKEDDKAS